MDAEQYATLEKMLKIIKALDVLLERHFKHPRESTEKDNGYCYDLLQLYTTTKTVLPDSLSAVAIDIPFSNLESAPKQLHLADWTQEGILRALRNLSGAIKELLIQSNNERNLSDENLDEMVNYTNLLLRKDKSEAIPTHKSATKFSRWGEIKIRFISETEVILTKNDGTHPSTQDFTQLGFAKGSAPERWVKSWDFLFELGKNNGTFDVSSFSPNDKRSCTERKREVSRRLQSYFGLHDKPFHTINNGVHQTKFAVEVGDGVLPPEINNTPIDIYGE